MFTHFRNLLGFAVSTHAKDDPYEGISLAEARNIENALRGKRGIDQRIISMSRRDANTVLVRMGAETPLGGSGQIVQVVREGQRLRCEVVGGWRV